MSSPPPTIFSPSLYQKHLTLQADWSVVDSWLQSLYPTSPLPPFERNPQTLSILLSLSRINASVNSTIDLLFASERQELEDLKQISIKSESTSDTYVERTLEKLSNSLSPSALEELDILAGLQLDMSCATPDVPNLASGIMSCQMELFELRQSRDRVDMLQSTLQRELDAVKHILLDFRSQEGFQPRQGIGQEIAERQKMSRALAAKVEGGVERGAEERIHVWDIEDCEKRYRELEKVVRGLEDNVTAFQGLPYEVETARGEVEGLRMEVEQLVSRRDELFEELVVKESPVRRMR